MKYKDIVVKEGQSLYDIAIRYYGAVNRVDTIVSDNALTLDDDLFTGQVLKIQVDDRNRLIFNEVTDFFDKGKLDANNSRDIQQVVPEGKPTPEAKAAIVDPKPRKVVDRWVVQSGQSIYDIAQQWYGDISFVDVLLLDNNLLYDDSINSGKVLKLRPELIKVQLDNRAANNNDNIDRITGVLRIVVTAVGNETNGNDGFVLIDVLGGMPSYTFLWTKDDGTITRTSQNLVAVPSGTYTLVVTDANMDTATLIISIAAPIIVYDNWIDELNNTFVDEDGNRFIF